MAKNNLGELEDAPGASRRERAYFTRLAREGIKREADAYHKLSNGHFEAAEILNDKGDLARAFTRKELPTSPWEYRRQALDRQEAGIKALVKAEELSAKSAKLGRQAFKHEMIAAVQTVLGRLGFNLG